MTPLESIRDRLEAILAEVETLIAAQPPAAAAPPTKKLTPADYEQAARSIPTDVKTIRGVAKVESGPLGGFAPDGRPIILFEPHIFSRLTQHRFDSTHGGVSYPNWRDKPYPPTQAARWDQLEYAMDLDHDAALQSASYGLFQIMGFNFAVCGFPNVTAFVAAMRISEREHLAAFLAFVKSKGLDRHLISGNWLAFATGYNGSGQAAAYAAKIEAAVKAA